MRREDRRGLLARLLIIHRELTVFTEEARRIDLSTLSAQSIGSGIKAGIGSAVSPSVKCTPSCVLEKFRLVFEQTCCLTLQFPHSEVLGLSSGGSPQAT